MRSSLAMSRWSHPSSRLFRSTRLSSRKYELIKFAHHFTTQSYQSIGSFHSENLADLMAQSDEEYTPPVLPFQGDIHIHSDHSFLLDLEHWTFLNHGAFGAALGVGYQRAASWRRYLERQPLRYFDRDLLPHLACSTRQLANFISVDRQSLTLLPNVTSGLNSILASYVREFGDAAHIILWDTSYGSVKKMAQQYCGDAVTEIHFSRYYLDRLAASSQPETVVQEALDDVLSGHDWTGKHPLLILDHTTSNTALTFPINELAEQAKEANSNMMVLVDGAHGLLAQDIKIDEFIDFYVSNGHKWLSAPRGVGMMYASHKWHSILRPAVMSHGVDEHDLLSRFVWDGCRDYAAALSLPAVLDYWQERDPEVVRQECKNMLRSGIAVLAQAWYPPDHVQPEAWPGKVTLASFDSIMLSPMALIKLPFGHNKTSDDAKAVQDYLYDNHIEVPIKCINEELYVRISCFVYNTIQDFEILGEAIRRYHPS